MTSAFKVKKKKIIFPPVESPWVYLPHLRVDPLNSGKRLTHDELNASVVYILADIALLGLFFLSSSFVSFFDHWSFIILWLKISCFFGFCVLVCIS